VPNNFERNERKVVFEDIASEYHAMRPGYPDALIDDVTATTGIEAGGSILEIGCGSGQATRSFAPRGYAILGIDISPSLVRIAASEFAGYPNAQFRTVAFEELDEAGSGFDLVVAATSWHWIDPDIRYGKAARLLKPGGSLVILANLFPEPFFTGFFRRAQHVYRDVVPEWGDPDSTKTTMDIIRETEVELRDCGMFRDVVRLEREWEVVYDRDEYFRLLTTYSDHRLLGADRLARLFDGLASIIDNEYGGRVIRSYLSVAYIGKHLSSMGEFQS